MELGPGRRPGTGRGWSEGGQAGRGRGCSPHLFSGVPRRSRIALVSLLGGEETESGWEDTSGPMDRRGPASPPAFSALQAPWRGRVQ